MWQWAMAVVALALTACGGEVQRGPKENPEPAPGGDSPADPAEQGSDNSVQLGDCMAGFDQFEEPERDCNWVVEDRCYEDKLEACACACPGGTAVSTCSSGFPQQNGRVPVYCS
jgi:hypothetical protein